MKHVVYIGDPNMAFSSPSTLWDAQTDAITFCVKDKVDEPISAIRASKASVIIADSHINFDGISFENKTVVVVEDPRETIIKILNQCFPSKNMASGIHPTASIDKDATIHPSAHIGPNCVIGKVSIQENTVIHANVVINDNVTIGKNVIIFPGCVIGYIGYGYYKDESGKLLNFPHFGGVTIGDDVEIGANTCVDRGTLGNTVIKNGAKIDNLCHIAHNVVVGENSMVIALAMIGGSTKLGEGSWIAPSATLRDGIKIGRNSLVGLGAVVTKDVPDGVIVVGNPAKPYVAKVNK